MPPIVDKEQNIESKMLDMLSSELKASRKETKEGLEKIETAVTKMSDRVASQSGWNIIMVVILVLGMVASTGGSLYLQYSKDGISGGTGTASYRPESSTSTMSVVAQKDVP
jgi:hypothetical protein